MKAHGRRIRVIGLQAKSVHYNAGCFGRCRCYSADSLTLATLILLFALNLLRNPLHSICVTASLELELGSSEAQRISRL